MSENDVKVVIEKKFEPCPECRRQPLSPEEMAEYLKPSLTVEEIGGISLLYISDEGNVIIYGESVGRRKPLNIKASWFTYEHSYKELSQRKKDEIYQFFLSKGKKKILFHGDQ